MSKRKKGHEVYKDAHPLRPWIPDTIGHLNNNGVIVDNNTKEILEGQIKNIRRQLGIPPKSE